MKNKINENNVKLPFYLRSWFIVIVLFATMLNGFLIILTPVIIPTLLILRIIKTKNNKIQLIKSVVLSIFNILFISSVLITGLLTYNSEPTATNEIQNINNIEVEDDNKVNTEPKKEEIDKFVDNQEITITDESTNLDDKEKDNININKSIDIINNLKLPKYGTTLGNLITDFMFIDGTEKIGDNIYRTKIIIKPCLDLLSSEIYINTDISKNEVMSIDGSITAYSMINDKEIKIQISNIDNFQKGLNYAIPFTSNILEVNERGITYDGIAVKILTIFSNNNDYDKHEYVAVAQLTNFYGDDKIITRDIFSTIDSDGVIMPTFSLPEYETDIGDNGIRINKNESMIVSFGVDINATKKMMISCKYDDFSTIEFKVIPVITINDTQEENNDISFSASGKLVYDEFYQSKIIRVNIKVNNDSDNDILISSSHFNLTSGNGITIRGILYPYKNFLTEGILKSGDSTSGYIYFNTDKEGKYDISYYINSNNKDKITHSIDIYN